MADFTPITSQAQLDEVLKDRLRRAEERNSKRFEGYLSPDEVAAQHGELTKQVADLTAALDASTKKVATHEQALAERDSKIKAFESRATRHRIANELGLSYDAVDFIGGDDEDSIRTSAEALKSLIGTTQRPAPAYGSEPKVDGDGTKSALRDMLKTMKG